MHAGAIGFPFADKFGRTRLRYVVDRKAAAKLRRAIADRLVIDDHDAVLCADLVGVPALRQIEPRQQPRLEWIGDVDDAGSARGLHVADVEDGAVDPDLTTAGTVDVRHELG